MNSRKHLWLAGVGFGALAAALTATPAAASPLNITVTGTVQGGVLATNKGTGTINITVTNTGSVSNINGAGISATADQGAITISNAGPVSGATNAIVATTNSPNGVSIAVGANLTADGLGAAAVDDATGKASVTMASGTGSTPISISDVGGVVGADAVSLFGPASITLGSHDTVTAGAPGLSGTADVAALAVLTAADSGGPSASVAVGTNDTFVLQGNSSAAITAHTGAGTIGASGTASALITVGNGVAIHASGLSDSGVIGFVADPSGEGNYLGTGNVNVTVGTGAITVDEIGAVGTPTGRMTNTGVTAISAGGNVLVDNAAVVNVSGGQDASVGLATLTAGSGNSTINSRGSITSLNGDGIRATTANGANVINVLGGNIVASNGSGVDAIATGGGNISVTTASGTDVKTATPTLGTFYGISATSGSGSVTVVTNGTVSDGGVNAVTGSSGSGSGSVTVVASKAVSDTAGFGIFAAAGNGPVTVVANGVVTAADDGILAQASPSATTSFAPVSVTVNAAVTSTGAAGVVAENFNDGQSTITTASGTGAKPLAITSAQIGLLALNFFGTAQVVVGAHNTITGGGNGAFAGAVSADTLDPVSVAPGQTGASVKTGIDDTFVFQGNDAAAVSASSGFLTGGLPNQASVSIAVGNGVALHASGFDTDGVLGFVADPSGQNSFTGTGSVSVTVGTGAITVDESGASGSPGGRALNIGVGALSGGGNVLVDDAATVSVSGVQDHTIGLYTATSGSGTSTINARASVTSLNGDAIQSTTASGANTVNVLGGNVAATGGDGIDSVSGSGAVSITTNGVVTASGGGVFGQSAGAGGVTIAVNQSVAAGGTAAVEALDLNFGPGSAAVTIGSGTAKTPLTISAASVGAEAVSLIGPASVVVGSHDSFTVGASGVAAPADVVALDLLAPADILGGPSASVSVGTNDSFVVQGNNGAAISAQVGQAGVSGPIGGTASAVATVGNGVNIHVSGLSDAGVIGFVTDPSGANKFHGAGNVSVTVGTGVIVVDEVGESGLLTGAATNAGVVALSAGGNVLLDNSAQVTVSGGLDSSIGLSAATSGAGSVTVDSRASVTSLNGDGIRANGGNGADTVNVTAGKVAATGGDGIEANSGSGAITINTAASTDVRTNSAASFSGIFANSGAGNITIVTGGTVSDGGISAITDGSGAVAITTNGAVTDTGGDAIFGEASSGAISITTNGVVTGSLSGVLAISDSGDPTVTAPVSVTINANIQAADGAGALAESLTAGLASLVTASGTAGKPLTITTPQEIGVDASSLFGEAQVMIGDHNTINAGLPGLTVANDIVAEGQIVPTAATPAAVIVTGIDDIFRLQGNDQAAISASGGEAAAASEITDLAPVSIAIGNGVNLHASGYDVDGVLAFNADPTGASSFANPANATVIVGTGAVTVDETGALGTVDNLQRNIGVGALSGGGNVLVDDAATVTVSGGLDSSIGLYASTTGTGTSTVLAKASVTSANGDAIQSSTTGGDNFVDVLGGKITGSGDAVDAFSSGGDVAVATAAGTSVKTTTPGSSWGIFAKSGSGSVSVNAQGAVSDGGINAVSSSGPVSVLAAAVTDTNGVGIDATSGSGPVNVATTGLVTSSGNGVIAVGGGPVQVVANGSMTSAGAVNILAESIGANTASTITASGVSGGTLVFKGAQQAALDAISLGGQARVSVGDFNTASAGASGLSAVGTVVAISHASGGPSSALVVLGANDTITAKGNASAAVVGSNQAATFGTGGVAISTGAGLSIHTSGFDSAGIIGDTFDPSGKGAFAGAGAVTIVVGGGQITVDEAGASGASSGSMTNAGVVALSAGGNVSIDDSAVINATGGVDTSVGLRTFTLGPGNSTVTVRNTVTSHQGDGVFATTSGGLNNVAVLGSAISAPHGSAVDAVDGAGGTVQVKVTAGGSLNGQTGVTATSGSGAVFVGNQGQIVGGTGGGVVTSSSGAITMVNFAGALITAGGGAGGAAVASSGSGVLSLDNQGTIGASKANFNGLAVDMTGSGGLNLTNEAGAVLDGDIIGADNVAFNNAGTWQTKGTSDFGSSAGASSNVLNNTGTILIGQSGPASSVSAATFADLGAFNNGSSSAAGAISMVNGKQGDNLTVSGLFTGAASAGGSNSILALDAFLGGPGSKADELILQGGSAGLTYIQITNVAPASAAALNSKGIVLVAGASHAGDFALDPNQPGYDAGTHGIDSGLFTYPLAYAGTNEVLVGVPGLPAAQMATMASAAEQIWSSTTPGDESAAGLVASLASSGDTGGPKVWAKIVNGGPSLMNRGSSLLGQAGFANGPSADTGAPMAGAVSQSANVTAFGMSYGFDTGYSQSVSAFLTGVDLGRHIGQTSAWSWGLSTGYLESQQSFTSGSSLALYQGALAALHGAYVNGGFYLAGDAKVTLMQVNYLTSWGGGLGDPTSNITTFGGEADAGYRHALGGAWTLEPTASISMQSSHLGTLAVSNTEVSFGAANSVRVGVGAKLDGGWKLFGLQLKNTSSFRVWDELEGANTLNLGETAGGYVLPDQIGGVFADAADAVSLESADGRTSAFVSGAYRWKADYHAAQLSAGFKLHW